MTWSSLRNMSYPVKFGWFCSLRDQATARFDLRRSRDCSWHVHHGYLGSAVAGLVAGLVARLTTRGTPTLCNFSQSFWSHRGDGPKLSPLKGVRRTNTEHKHTLTNINNRFNRYSSWQLTANRGLTSSLDLCICHGQRGLSPGPPQVRREVVRLQVDQRLKWPILGLTDAKVKSKQHPCRLRNT